MGEFSFGEDASDLVSQLRAQLAEAVRELEAVRHRYASVCETWIRREKLLVDALEEARGDLVGLSSNWARDVAARLDQALAAIRAGKEKP